MSFLLGALMLLLLLRSQTALAAALAAARLFAGSVLPGLLPYMTLALMLVSRLSRPFSPAALLLLGWGGGSPTGARLLHGYTGPGRGRLAVRCATMSPMFLLGTAGGWLQNRAAGAVILFSVLASAWLTGFLVREEPPARSSAGDTPSDSAPLSLGEAIDAAARTMLMVCGTMMLLRTLAALASEALAARAPGAALALTTLLEVTTGAAALAQLPLPLSLRTALIAGATGFGGAAVLLQNRAAYPAGTLSLPRQIVCQAVHGALAFLLALGMMTLAGGVRPAI